MGMHNIFEKVRCLADKDLSMCMPREIKVQIIQRQRSVRLSLQTLCQSQQQERA